MRPSPYPGTVRWKSARSFSGCTSANTSAGRAPPGPYSDAMRTCAAPSLLNSEAAMFNSPRVGVGDLDVTAEQSVNRSRTSFGWGRGERYMM